jgi:hypothetical protein
MSTVTGYRLGSRLIIEELDHDPAAGQEGEPVTLGLAEGVRLGRSACSERLFYRRGAVYGMRLSQALAAGWCWFEEEAVGGN